MPSSPSSRTQQIKLLLTKAQQLRRKMSAIINATKVARGRATSLGAVAEPEEQMRAMKAIWDQIIAQYVKMHGASPTPAELAELWKMFGKARAQSSATPPPARPSRPVPRGNTPFWDEAEEPPAASWEGRGAKPLRPESAHASSPPPRASRPVPPRGTPPPASWENIPFGEDEPRYQGWKPGAKPLHPGSGSAPSSAQEMALRLLGLTAPYTAAQVKTAFKQAALRTHPDKGGSHAKFLAVKDAANLLLQSLGERVMGVGGKTTHRPRVSGSEWGDASREPSPLQQRDIRAMLQDRALNPQMAQRLLHDLLDFHPFIVRLRSDPNVSPQEIRRRLPLIPKSSAHELRFYWDTLQQNPSCDFLLDLDPGLSSLFEQKTRVGARDEKENATREFTAKLVAEYKKMGLTPSKDEIEHLIEQFAAAYAQKEPSPMPPTRWWQRAAKPAKPTASQPEQPSRAPMSWDTAAQFMKSLFYSYLLYQNILRHAPHFRGGEASSSSPYESRQETRQSGYAKAGSPREASSPPPPRQEREVPPWAREIPPQARPPHARATPPPPPRRRPVEREPARPSSPRSTPQQAAMRLLGLRDPCTATEVKSAFRRAAMKAHPDRGGSQAKFLAVKDAANLLLQGLGERVMGVDRKERARTQSGHTPEIAISIEIQPTQAAEGLSLREKLETQISAKKLGLISGHEAGFTKRQLTEIVVFFQPTNITLAIPQVEKILAAMRVKHYAIWYWDVVFAAKGVARKKTPQTGTAAVHFWNAVYRADLAWASDLAPYKHWEGHTPKQEKGFARKHFNVIFDRWFGGKAPVKFSDKKLGLLPHSLLTHHSDVMTKAQEAKLRSKVYKTSPKNTKK